MTTKGAERFEIVEKLGEGGMGVVYHARDRTLGGDVALKTLRRLDASSLYRFKREFRAVSDLSHPNIVALHELFAEGDEWFFTMELVRGVNLIEWVRDGRPFKTKKSKAKAARVPLSPAPTPSGPTTEVAADPPWAMGTPQPPRPNDPRRHMHDLIRPDRLYDALTQLAHALMALHDAGMVHRDLKPSNVRVTEDGHVVLMDFGIVAETSGDMGTRRGEAALGTPYFMAPEQVAGDPPTAAADWYAFGVILHLAITGRLPFRGHARDVLRAKQRETPPPPDKLARGIPPLLSELCSRLLLPRASRRADGHEVLQVLTGVSQPTGQTRLGRDAPLFVGREDELEILRRTYRRALKGRSECVFVEGGSGVGKTSLVGAFLHQLQQRERGKQLPIVLRGRCHERERMSYKAVDGVIDNLAQELSRMAESVLEPLIPDDGHLLLRLFPVLQAVPGIEPPEEPEELGVEELRSNAIEALRTLLTRIAATRPIVAYIDDLQWADRDSLNLLLALARAPTPAPMLLIASLRAENLDANPDLLKAVDAIAERFAGGRIILGRLSAREQEELLTRLAGETPVDDNTRQRLLEEAKGLPLMLVELMRYHEHLTDPDPDHAGGIDDMILRRVSQLPPEARALAEVMAVAGEPTPVSLLAEAAVLAAEDRERATSAVRAAHLCRVAGSQPEAVLVPYHDRVREAIAGDLGRQRRTEIHRRLAEALEAAGGSSPDLLGRHWLGAGDSERAAAYFETAADRAAEVLAFDYAADRYQLAVFLTSSEEPELLARLAHALSLAGRGFEAANVYERAASRADGPRALELERLSAHHLLRSGRMEAGLAKTEEVMRKLGAPFARTRRRAAVSLLLQRARLALRGGYGYRQRRESEVDSRDLDRLDTMYAAASSLGMIDHLRGAAAQTHHLRTALRVGEERRVCRALAIETAFLVAPGGRGVLKANDVSRDAILQAKRLDDPYLLGIAQMAYGGMRLFSGHPKRALSALLEAGPLLSRSRESHQWERVTARYFLALVQIALGQLRAASTTTARSLDEAERGNDAYAGALFKCIPATWDMLRRGADREAIRSIKDALRDWPEHDFYVANYLQSYSRAVVHLYRGEGAGAAEVLDECIPDVRRLLLLRMPWVRGEIYTLQGRAGLQSGDRKRVARALRELERNKLQFFAGTAALIRGGAAAMDGNTRVAQERTADAISHFREIGARQLRAAATYRLGVLLGGAQGARMVEQAESWATSEAVADLDRMANLLAPGFAPPRT